MNDISRRIEADLRAMQDVKFREFHLGLIPNVAQERIIGVRTPCIRAYARDLSASPDGAAFMAELPHPYYEMDNLHACLIDRMRDYDACLAALDAFLPHVDNWATCDMMNLKLLARQPERFLACIDRWMHSDHTYTVRFGIAMLMKHFLGDRFDRTQMDAVCAIRSDEYYINMMAAWYMATALAFQPEAAMDALNRRVLPVWTHNKAIQKAVESRRIPVSQKELLKSKKY